MHADENLLRNYIQSIINNDINTDNLGIELLDEAEIEIMNQNNNSGIKEFLTVISLNDNPNLNLEVAQPCKYRIDKKITTGIICYTLDALDILKENIGPNEKIVKVGVKTKECKILDLCSYKDKQRLKEVYATITNKSVIKSDVEFIDYVCRKSNKRYNAVKTIIALGNVMYDGSNIPDYMGISIILKTENLIEYAVDMK